MLSRAPGSSLDRLARICARLAALPLLCLAAVTCTELPSEVEQSGSCTSLAEISMNETHSGQLSPDDCPGPNGGFSDRWSLSVSSETSVRIDLRSSAFDAYLEIHNGSGGMIAWNDDTAGLDSRIIHTLAAGSYVVLVRAYAPGQTGGYTLAVTQGPNCTPVGALAIGTTVAGALEASDCPSEWNAPMDHWSLTLSETRRLRFDLESAQFDEVLLIRDPQGTVVRSADWNHPAGHARIDTELPAGSWTVSASAPSEASRGAYELTVRPTPPCTPGTDIVIGESVSGELTPDACLFDGWMQADSFGITVDVETSVHVTLKSDDFAPLVILRDQSGNDVAVGHDQTQARIAQFRVTLPPGTYALFVTGYPPIGEYSLTVDEVVCSAPQPLTFGQTVSGALDPSDCMRAGGAFHESWRLVFADSATTHIALSSAAFDAYLVLRDTMGVVLRTDDDSGPGLDSQMQILLAAGTYDIVATSYAPGATGSYTLTVGAPPSLAAGVTPFVDARESKPAATPAAPATTELLESYRHRRRAPDAAALLLSTPIKP
jgi:hypothetical protein